MNNISTCHPVHEPTALTGMNYICLSSHHSSQIQIQNFKFKINVKHRVVYNVPQMKQNQISSLYTTKATIDSENKRKKRNVEGEGALLSCCLTRYTTFLNLAWRFPNRGSCQIAGAWSTKSFAQGQLQPFPVEWNRRCLVNFSLFIVSFHEEIKSESLA